MYAAAHTALALAAKRRTPAASLFGLMVAAQASELAWIGLTYAGIERPTIDDHGTLHLEHLPYSHSLLVSLGGGVLLWALLRYLLHRPQIATVMGLMFASHIVLDVIQHEPNVRLAPWMPHPVLGLDLTAYPMLDFAVETTLSVVCWAYYRGSRKLLAALVALNLSNLPLMFAGEGGASPMAHNRFILPTTILVTVLLAWGLTFRYASPAAGRNQTQVPAREPTEQPAAA